MIIFRYLTKEIIRSTIATSLVLLIIFVTNRFAHYLNDAASGKLTIHAVMLVMGLQVPYLFGFLLPLALFLGVMLSLGRLYVDHEMVVLSSCGMSKLRVVSYIMLIAFVVMLFDAWLTFYIEPTLFRYRSEIVTSSIATLSLKKMIPGRFQTLGNDRRVLYVGKVGKDHDSFSDVFVAVRSDANVSRANRAFQWNLISAEGALEKTDHSKRNFFVFTNGNRYAGTPGKLNFSETGFSQFWYQPEAPTISMSGRYSLMSNTELIHLYSHDRHAVAEFQWRLTWTLSTMLLALLAIPLSEVNPRKGKFAQLLPAILIYVVFLNMMFVGKTWVQDGQVPTWLGLWWIDAVLFLIAMSIYAYQLGWRRMFPWFSRGKA